MVLVMVLAFFFKRGEGVVLCPAFTCRKSKRSIGCMSRAHDGALDQQSQQDFDY